MGTGSLLDIPSRLDSGSTEVPVSGTVSGGPPWTLPFHQVVKFRTSGYRLSGEETVRCMWGLRCVGFDSRPRGRFSVNEDGDFETHTN